MSYREAGHHPEHQRRFTREEIQRRLHLYHSLSQNQWELIQKEGAIFSYAELVRRGLIKDTGDEMTEEDMEHTTGGLDKAIGSDQYVFLSHDAQKYGDVLLEINPSVLEKEGTVVNTAGDYLNFANNPDLEEYYKNSQIPGNKFFDWLTDHVNRLPNPGWFFGEDQESLKRFLKEAMVEKVKGNTDKFKTYWSLHPEIKVLNQVPLSYVKRV